MSTRSLSTTKLIGALADRYKLGRRQVREVFGRAASAEDADRIFLVATALHATQCADPETCPRCIALARRLDEEDVTTTREAVLEIEHLHRVGRAAEDFIAALDTPHGVDRGALVAGAAAQLRATLDRSEDDLSMARSKYTRSERVAFAEEAAIMNRREVGALAERLGVAPTTIYNWKRELEEGTLTPNDPSKGDEQICSDGSGSEQIPNVAQIPRDPTELIELRARVRVLEKTVADLVTENLALRHQRRGVAA